MSTPGPQKTELHLKESNENEINSSPPLVASPYYPWILHAYFHNLYYTPGMPLTPLLRLLWSSTPSSVDAEFEPPRAAPGSLQALLIWLPSVELRRIRY